MATYWPEFAQAGKERLPVRFLLSPPGRAAGHRPHADARGGLGLGPGHRRPSPNRAPFWEPGTAHGYHAVTYGYLVGEVVRRISGRSLGTFFADEVAGPLGLEFYIGLPGELEARVSPIVGRIDPQCGGGGGGGAVSGG